MSSTDNEIISQALDKLPDKVWGRRYVWFKWFVIFCAVNIQLLLIVLLFFKTENSALVVQIAISLVTAATTALGLYIFGASLDNKNQRSTIENITRMHMTVRTAGPAPTYEPGQHPRAETS